MGRCIGAAHDATGDQTALLGVRRLRGAIPPGGNAPRPIPARRSPASRSRRSPRPVTPCGFEPAKAFDEDITFGTGWSASSPAVPQTLTAELTAAHNLNGVRIHWGKDSSWYTFDLQTSTDGATWNTVFSGLTRAYQYTLPEVCTAKDVRQIRVVVTQVSGGGAQTIAGIAEVILYGTPA